MDRELSPSTVFTYWVLLSLLHGGVIFHSPITLKHAKDGLSALSRLDAYFFHSSRPAEAPDDAPPPPPLPRPRLRPALRQMPHAAAPAADPDAAAGAQGVRVTVTGAAFSWEADHPLEPLEGDAQVTPPCLVDVNLDIAPGTFAAIVGATGSGKSTLLLSLLRETQRVCGSIHITGPKCPAEVPPGWPDEPRRVRAADGVDPHGRERARNVLFGAPTRPRATRRSCASRRSARTSPACRRATRRPSPRRSLGGQKQRLSDRTRRVRRRAAGAARRLPLCARRQGLGARARCEGQGQRGVRS